MTLTIINYISDIYRIWTKYGVLSIVLHINFKLRVKPGNIPGYRTDVLTLKRGASNRIYRKTSMCLMN